MADKRLSVSAMVYLVSTMANKSVPFLLIPLLTRWLTADQYGVLGLFSAFLAIGGVYVGLRPEVYLFRCRESVPHAEYKAVQSAAVVVAVVSALLFWLVCMVTLPLMDALSGDANLFAILLAFNCLIIALQRIYDTEMQAEFRSVNYALIKFLGIAGHAVIVVPLILYVSASWVSKVAAEIMGNLLALAVSIRLLGLVRIDFGGVLERAKGLISYLFPLTFHVLGFSIINIGDKVFIGAFMGVAAVGVYTVAYSFGLVLSAVHESALKVWNPYFFKMYRPGVRNAKILKLQAGYAVLSIFMFISYVLVADWLFERIVGPGYSVPPYLLVVVGAAYSFEGVRKVIAGYLYGEGRTVTLAVITMACAAVNAVMNYLLIPSFGLMGAAYATLLSFFLMLVATVFCSARVYVSSTAREVKGL